MIRYPNALSPLEAQVNAEAPTWLDRAKARTGVFAGLGKYAEEYTDAAGDKKTLSPFWSEVKRVFMRLQHNKCIYCETKLEGREFAPVQWDLEHFRPKGNVRPWPAKKSAFAYDFPTGDGSATGYYLLAYHLHNYAAACKTCNSPFKSDYFPVASARIANKPHPKDYAAEESFLVYPLGVEDDDPEDLLTFDGAEAAPKHESVADLRRWRRARVMIDFFGLNRDGLVASRAWWLLHAVWPNVLLADGGAPTGLKNLARIRSERAPFTNCAKCFLTLCASDRPKAEAKIPEFEKIVESMED